MISANRIVHSIQVAETAEKLAKIWQVNREEAFLSGLWHDIAKDLTPKDFFDLGLELSQELLTIFQEYPKIFHAFSAPLLLEKKLKITNTNILSAIKWHTTGKAELTDLEKIIYISDYIEPGRPFKEKEDIWVLAKQDLNRAVLATATASLKYLKQKKVKIYPSLIECWEYYKELEAQKHRGTKFGSERPFGD